MAQAADPADEKEAKVSVGMPENDEEYTKLCASITEIEGKTMTDVIDHSEVQKLLQEFAQKNEIKTPKAPYQLNQLRFLDYIQLFFFTISHFSVIILCD